MSTQRKADAIKAIFLALILAALGIILLLSVLNAESVVFASQEQNKLGSPTSQPSDPTTAASVTDDVRITKTVEPPDPDTGEVVSICFTISGLGPRELDVVLAQDVSNSMNNPAEGGTTQTRLQASQVAASAFVDSLPSADRTAVVSYSTSARVAQPLTTTKSVVTGIIYSLTTRGGTNIGEGISVSHKELITSPRYLPDTIKTIILLSDGQATQPGEGEQPKEYARERARAAARHNIKIYTIGFGGDADGDLLQDLAAIGSGRYFFAPDEDVLKTIYLTIALELHNLVITDILTPGVEADCSQWPNGWCVVGPSGVTTLTFSFGDSDLITDPLRFCFPATANLDPNYEGPTNLSGSGICYQDSNGQENCEYFENPRVIVGGRKIAGSVFHDVNRNGQQDVGETGAADVVVRTSTDVTTTTDVSGRYVLRVAREPAISVTLEIPPGYTVTTPISYHIPPITGIYPHRNFGIYGKACVQGKVFDDENANGKYDQEEGLAGAKITVSGGTTTTTGSDGLFDVCAAVNDAPIIITETDPPGYTSTVAIGGTGIEVIDVNTLRIDSPEAGRTYDGNKFGDSRLTARLSIIKKSSAERVSVDDILRFTLIYTNAGYAATGDLRLTDSLPSGLEYLPPASWPPVTYTSGNELIWDLPSLEARSAGEPIVITVAVKSSASGPVLRNCVELRSREHSASDCTSIYVGWSVFLPFVTRPQRIYLPIITKYHPLPQIVNGGFENGWTGWTHDGALSKAISTSYPHSGSSSALLGDSAYECRNGVPVGSAWIEQIVLVPYTENPRLSFSYRIFSQDRNPYLVDEFDTFDVKINGIRLFRDAKKTGPYGCDLKQEDIDLGWKTREISLQEFRDQQITIRFQNRSNPDGWFNTWTYVDDVQFIP